MQLYVSYYNFSEQGDDGKEWGEWWKTNQYNFHSIHTKEPKYGTYENITFKGELKDKLYYVWVKYDAGDSFGADRGRMCDIGIYDSYEKACQVKKMLEEDDVKHPDYRVDLVDPDGLPINTGTWKGYFEQFDSVEIEELEVDKDEDDI